MKAVVGIWGAVPIALLQDERITHAALKTYIALASFQGTKDECFPGIEDIAERAGMSARSIRDGLQALRESDWITSRRRGLGKTNVYRVKMALETQESADPERQTSADQEVQTSADPLILSSPNPSSPLENTTRKHRRSGERPDPELKPLVQYYIDKHKEIRGFEPTVAWPRDMAIMKRIRVGYKPEAIRQLLDTFFAWKGRSKTTLRDFADKVDTLYGVLKDKAEGKR